MSSEGSPAADPAGESSAVGLRVAVVAARFHGDITDALVEGARRCLAELGAGPDAVEVFRVPGAWELPQAARVLLAKRRHDALIALGCVIRGETPHFEYVSAAAAQGLGAVARASDVPVSFGVLTTDDRAQALARAGDGPDNKGYEAALAVLEMVTLFRRWESP